MSAFDFAPRVTALLLDAGNTLMWLDHPRITALMNDAGVPCTLEELTTAEMHARPRLDPHLGKAPKRETPHIFGLYVQYTLDNLPMDVPADAADRIRAGLQEIWSDLWVSVPPDAASTLAALHDRGYRLGVVSNSNGTVESMLRGAGLTEWLDCVVDSTVEGVEKPDPRIFHIGAERLGTAADRCAYIGDFHAIDVVGARAAGMHGMLMDPVGAWDGVDAPRVRALGDLLEHFTGVDRREPGTDHGNRPGPTGTGDGFN